MQTKGLIPMLLGDNLHLTISCCDVVFCCLPPTVWSITYSSFGMLQIWPAQFRLSLAPVLPTWAIRVPYMICKFDLWTLRPRPKGEETEVQEERERDNSLHYSFCHPIAFKRFLYVEKLLCLVNDLTTYNFQETQRNRMYRGYNFVSMLYVFLLFLSNGSIHCLQNVYKGIGCDCNFKIMYLLTIYIRKSIQ